MRALRGDILIAFSVMAQAVEVVVAITHVDADVAVLFLAPLFNPPMVAMRAIMTWTYKVAVKTMAMHVMSMVMTTAKTKADANP